LLVDDAETNRDLVTRFLSDAGVTVVTACNGQEAIDALTDENGTLSEAAADVVLMDMQMPILDGYSATAKLCEAGFETPIVAMTANSMVGDDSKCRRAGCSDYLSKPIDLDALLEMIRTWASKPGSEDPVAGKTVLKKAASRVDHQPDNGTSMQSTEKLSPVGVSTDSEFEPRLPDNWLRKYAVDLVGKAGAQMPAIRESFETGDLDEVARQIHWLKGSGGTVGLAQLTELAKSCEKAARDSDLEVLIKRIDQIEDYLSQLALQCDDDD